MNRGVQFVRENPVTVGVGVGSIVIIAVVLLVFGLLGYFVVKKTGLFKTKPDACVRLSVDDLKNTERYVELNISETRKKLENKYEETIQNINKLKKAYTDNKLVPFNKDQYKYLLVCYREAINGECRPFFLVTKYKLENVIDYKNNTDATNSNYNYYIGKTKGDCSPNYSNSHSSFAVYDLNPNLSVDDYEEKEEKEEEEEEEEEEGNVGKTKFISVHIRGAKKTAAIGEIKVYDELGQQVSIIENSQKIIGLEGPITSGYSLVMGDLAYDDDFNSYSSFAYEADINYQYMVWELEKPTSVSKVYIYRRPECKDQEWCQDRTDHMNIVLHRSDPAGDETGPTGDPTHIYTLRKVMHKDGAVDKTIPIEDFTPIDLSGDNFCVGIPKNELRYGIYGRVAADYHKCASKIGTERTDKMFSEINELKRGFQEGNLYLHGVDNDAQTAGYKYAFRTIGDPGQPDVCWGGTFLIKEIDMVTLSQYVDKRFCQYKTSTQDHPYGKYHDNKCEGNPVLRDHPLETDTHLVIDLSTPKLVD